MKITVEVKTTLKSYVEVEFDDAGDAIEKAADMVESGDCDTFAKWEKCEYDYKVLNANQILHTRV